MLSWGPGAHPFKFVLCPPLQKKSNKRLFNNYHFTIGLFIIPWCNVKMVMHQSFKKYVSSPHYLFFAAPPLEKNISPKQNIWLVTCLVHTKVFKYKQSLQKFKWNFALSHSPRDAAPGSFSGLHPLYAQQLTTKRDIMNTRATYKSWNTLCKLHVVSTGWSKKYAANIFRQNCIKKAGF